MMTTEKSTPDARPLLKLAAVLLGYTLLVILWGAVVRATGSGAGCGNHWPTCNGSFIPRPEATATLIEFSHRLSTTLLGALSVWLVVWSFRRLPAGHRGRAGSLAVLGLVLVEGAIGAALVRLELVAGDASVLRAWVMGLHLINTLILTAVIAVTLFWLAGGGRVRPGRRPRVAVALAIGLAGLLLVSAFGAVTALGDTLFPAATLAEGLAQDADRGAHFTVRLRVWHPILALVVSAYLVLVLRQTRAFRETETARRLANGALWLLSLQLLAGLINVALRAPIWLQLVHLLLANLLWLDLILLSATTLSRPAPRAAAPSASGDVAPLAAGRPVTDT